MIVENEEEKRDPINKYMIANVNNLLDIEECIHRDNKPYALILHNLYGNELVYKEDVGLDQNAQTKMYSINKNSIFRSLFF